MTPTAEATVLRRLAERVARTYVDDLQPRAVLVVGSAATGVADAYANIDMLVYHDAAPPP